MTQEEKQLLLKDLCARLPYGVIVQYKSQENAGSIKLGFGNIEYVTTLGHGWWKDCKPYLRPMSSMTEEEINEFLLISDTVLWLGNKRSTCIQMDWLNTHHFDYNGLIEKGLALEAPEGMYKTE